MKKLKHLFLAVLSLAAVACDSDDKPVATFEIDAVSTYPEGVAVEAIKSGSITFDELNTGKQYKFAFPMAEDYRLPAGTYDVAGEIVAEVAVDDAVVEKHLRVAANQQVVSATSTKIDLGWFFFNPQNTFVFGEIYITGSLNAAGTNGLYDSYFTIYNNTDEVLYADGLAIVESKLLNSSSDKILTPANQPQANFTVQTVYVIPGNGKSVPVEPGKSIKIADQAIDWSAQVAGALDHTDADFEWYDESSSSKIVDTDNPSVPNLDKWYSYSPTIWLPSNQCNRSYALVRFPEGMTAEQFLAEQIGDYTYVNAATGIEMNGTKCYLIKYEWIIDGVNLCPTEVWKQGALSAEADLRYAAISDKNSDKGRFGKKLCRKEAGRSALGNVILQDTNDSSADFEVVSAK